MVAVADRTNQPIFSQWASPYDWPWTISIVAMEARRIVSYYDLPEDKRPPKSIWHSATKCEEFVKKAWDNNESNSGMLDFNENELA